MAHSSDFLAARNYSAHMQSFAFGNFEEVTCGFPGRQPWWLLDAMERVGISTSTQLLANGTVFKKWPVDSPSGPKGRGPKRERDNQ